MAQKRETKFRKKVRADLGMLPNTAIFPIQQMSIRGDPDFFVCVNSMFVGLELKTDEKQSKTDPLQEHKLKTISNAKGLAMVVKPSNWDKAFEILKEIACARIDLDRDFTTH